MRASCIVAQLHASLPSSFGRHRKQLAALGVRVARFLIGERILKVFYCTVQTFWCSSACSIAASMHLGRRPQESRRKPLAHDVQCMTRQMHCKCLRVDACIMLHSRAHLAAPRFFSHMHGNATVQWHAQRQSPRCGECDKHMCDADGLLLAAAGVAPRQALSPPPADMAAPAPLTAGTG